VIIRVPKDVLKNPMKKQELTNFEDRVRTALGHAGFNLGHFRTSLTFVKRKCPVPKPDLDLSKDYAEMSEREFTQMLASITDLQILEGIANRRKILNAPQLKKYKQWQRDLIIQRKWEILHG
jgi:hypothetical protein